MCFCVFFPCSLASATIGKPPARYSLVYNNDIRHSDENFYSHRLEAFFEKKIPFIIKDEVAMLMIPFVEQRYNVRRQKRERTLVGIELGIKLIDFFYIAQQLRQAWRSEPVYNRGIIKNTNMAESISIIKMSFPLIPGKHKDIVQGYISGEYTYDFRLGRGSRIESIAGMLLPAGKTWEVNIDWRHRDRIHADDCDTFEAGVAYNF